MLRAAAIALALALLACSVYWPVHAYPFASLDDDVTVRDNPRVRAGLTAAGLRWALTTLDLGNWHPLTWLSHMAVSQLFGARPGAHHLANVALHAAATVLLFLALRAMTGSAGRSAFVAAAFAAHPLHVESVAWVSERKDVLCGVFWMLTLAAYARYVRRPRPATYAPVLLSFALALASKPMAVTLPLVLLLLDWWPLGRILAPREPGRGPRPFPLALQACEKLPLLALAAASSVVTVVAQGRGSAIRTLEVLPLAARLMNAAVAYAWYAAKTVWPSALAIVYPHPGASIGRWKVLLAALLLAVATWAAARARRSRPALAMGWLWYLGTIIPVIGLVQVGVQARADRYAYLPSVGLCILAAWGAPELWRRLRLPAALLPAAAGAAVLCLAAAASAQVRWWRDDEQLFRHALAVTRGNWLVHNNLGAVYMERNRFDDAVDEFREALRLRPTYRMARANLGEALVLARRREEAKALMRDAVRDDPHDPKANYQLGRLLARDGAWEEAAARLRTAVSLDPGNPVYRRSLDAVLERARGR